MFILAIAFPLSSVFAGVLGNPFPGSSDSILCDEGIGRQDGEFMLNGLADQHAVKGVFVMKGKFWEMSGSRFL